MLSEENVLIRIYLLNMWLIFTFEKWDQSNSIMEVIIFVITVFKIYQSWDS